MHQANRGQKENHATLPTSVAGAGVECPAVQSPDLVKRAWDYFNVQTKGLKYTPLIAPDDKPAVELNKEKMEKFLLGAEEVLLRSDEIQDLYGAVGDSVSHYTEVISPVLKCPVVSAIAI